MPDEYKTNLHYFAGKSMEELFAGMHIWQRKTGQHFLSISIEKDGDQFCCIALIQEPLFVNISGVGTSGGCLRTVIG
jgi:hypothetical protein